MASIKGVSIQDFSQWETLNGVAYKAVLLIDGKPVGHIYNEGNGGATMIQVPKEARKELEKRIKEYYHERPANGDSEEDFITELIDYYEYEETFRNIRKKNPKAIFVLEHKRSRLDDSPVTDIDELIPNQYVLTEAQLEQFMSKRSVFDIEIFRSIEDFNIYPFLNKRPLPDQFDDENIRVKDMEEEKEYVIQGEEAVSHLTLQKKNDTILATFTYYENSPDQTVVFPLSAIPLAKEGEFGFEFEEKQTDDYTLGELYEFASKFYHDYMTNQPISAEYKTKIKVYQNGELC